MELFKLAAKLTLDSSDFEKGIGKAESAGKQLAGKLSAATVAAGQIMAQYAQQAISAVTGLFSDAYNNYANYEQLIGGVETLFKDSADTVRQYAMNSFKTTGLSANDYMTTVTSFSASLLQGLKGDTEAAAGIANMAMVDIADNANKMGTDMQSIQNAYMGFAKGNYTMLDNLKLGYGGTATEMVRLINDSGVLDKKIKKIDEVTFDQTIQAIHEIQKQIGISGTTAEEAEKTISGSFGSMKASFQDALTAIGSGDVEWIDTAMANFKQAFATWFSNALPNAIRSVAGMRSMVQAIADVIVGASNEDIGNLVSAGLRTATGIVDAGRAIVKKLVSVLTSTLSTWATDPSDVRDFSESIGKFIGSAVSEILTNAPEILADIFTIGVNVAGGLIDGLMAGLFGTDDSLMGKYANIEKDMYEAISEAEKSSVKAEGILNYMEGLVGKYGEAAKGTEDWAAAVKALNEVMPGATEYINAQNQPLAITIARLQKMREELKQLAVEEAKRKALQSKMEAYTSAQAEVLEKEAQINIKNSEIDTARKSLIDYIRQYDKSFTGKGATAAQLGSAARSYANEKIGSGNQGYEEQMSLINTWESIMTVGEDKVNELTGELTSLKDQLKAVEVDYLTSSAAIDELTGSASGAAQALQAIKTPSVTYSSGEYYNYRYSKKATGLEWVPYDGYRAELHRGERILTAAENAEYSRGGYRGGLDYERVGAMIGSAINEAMSHIGVYLGAERVADLTSRRTGQNIRKTTNSRTLAMGG